MNKTIKRSVYLEQLIKQRDKKTIKVITGVRRAGKSTLLSLFQDYLLKTGVDEGCIVSFNFEDPENEISNWRELYDTIKKRLIPDKMTYIFLDEVQQIPEFERAVDGLNLKDNVDIYITGSNANMLSSEIATLLSGRYVEIHVLPLSFSEFCSTLDDKMDEARAYQIYIRNGGFPYLTNLDGDHSLIRSSLSAIYDTVILKDVMNRGKVKEPLILNSLVKFLFDNVGSLVSTNKIANTLNSNGRSCSVNTVESYLQLLIDSHIIYKVDRYNIRGKDFLKTGDKYYACDIGLKNYLVGEIRDTGSALENIIYLELKRRGYDIYVGKGENSEVDFVAKGSNGDATDPKNNGLRYIQVAQSVRGSEETLARELFALRATGDNYPKYLITLDYDTASYDGIQQISALDFLMGRVDI